MFENNCGPGYRPIDILEHFMDESPQPFLICRRDGRVIGFNRALHELLGYSREELLGKDWAADLTAPEWRKGEEQLLQEHISSGRPLAYEKECILKDGEKLSVAVLVHSLPLSAGDRLLYSFVYDIRSRKRAEQSLLKGKASAQRQVEYLNTLLNNMNELFYTYDLDGKITFVNKKSKDIMGYGPEEAKGMSLWDFLPDPAFVIDVEGKVVMWNRAMEELTGIKTREILGRGNREYSLPFYGNRRPMLIDLALDASDYDESEYVVFKKEKGIFYGESICGQNQHKEVYLSGKSAPLYDRSGKLIGAIESLRDVTKDRRAQKALRDSEEKYRNIIESIEDGYFEVDLAGNFTFFNPWLIKVLGYEAHEIEGCSYRKVMDKESGQKVFAAFNRAYNMGKSVKELDWQMNKKDGSPLMVETTVLPIKEDDRVTGFRGIVRDISERKRAEQALRQSENLYRTIFETTGTATIIIEDDMTVSLMNSEMERLVGYSKEEIEGKEKWLIFVDTEDRERIMKYHLWRQESPDMAPRNYEFKLITRDGMQREVVLTINMIPGTSQSVSSLLDITNRKMFEEALAISEARYRAIVEDQTELICRFMPNGELTFINDTYCDYFGKKYDELLGSNFKHNFFEEDLEMVEVEIAGLNLDNPVTTLEHRVKINNGGIRWQQWTHRALYNEKGTLVDYQSVGRDITERREAEQQLRFLSTHDSLTGLYNRLYFEEHMRLMETGGYETVGLVMCDVDGLKIVNDTLGHDRGDQLLKTAAGLISQCFRKSDIVARVGGDEFAVLLPSASGTEVEQILTRIRRKVKDYNISHPELPLSISLGYAICITADTTMGTILEEADNNMYREKLNSRSNARSSIIRTLIKALEARDFVAEGHTERLQLLVTKMAQALKLPERTVNDLRLLAQFHDIGKVGVPDSILFKKGLLTKAECAIMQRHCETGHRIALSAPELVLIADWILKHHEWWNGEGYPLGLKGEDIPLECRIMAIVDAYDAMTSDRPYRRAMTHEEAVAELKKYGGIQFDSELVNVFIKLSEKLKD